MHHLHKASRQIFEVGEYRDGDKTYDITVISYWKDAEEERHGSPVEIVGYYFGGYDKEMTDVYIDKWLDNRAKELSVLQLARYYMDAYLTVNRDVLDAPEVSRLEQCLTECCQLLDNRSWRFTYKHSVEWREAEKLKEALNRCIDAPGAEIQIVVKHDDGTTTTADLYDHAALVQGLQDALDYFQSEL